MGHTPMRHNADICSKNVKNSNIVTLYHTDWIRNYELRNETITPKSELWAKQNSAFRFLPRSIGMAEANESTNNNKPAIALTHSALRLG